jgi:hypothetical protein
MPLSKRLADAEKALNLRYETLSQAQKRLAMTDEIFSKTAIQQRIREEILPELRQCETEYWELLAQEARTCTIAEDDAGNAIVEVVREVQVIESKPNADYPDEVMQLLMEIRNKLNDPGNPAAAKAKLALSLIPGILAYEVELDTETALRKAFQPVRQLFKEALTEKK